MSSWDDWGAYKYVAKIVDGMDKELCEGKAHRLLIQQHINGNFMVFLSPEMDVRHRNLGDGYKNLFEDALPKDECLAELNRLYESGELKKIIDDMEKEHGFYSPDFGKTHEYIFDPYVSPYHYLEGKKQREAQNG